MSSSEKYQAQLLTHNLYKIFAGVYADFRANAVDEYKFELEPLGFEDFIDAVEKDLIKCIVLLENYIPTAFLVYTTAISEAIELNIIHCLGDEDLVEKRNLLMEKFLELTENERKEKIVCYPMLGKQGDFVSDIYNYGFKLIGIAVLRFMMNNPNCENVLNNVKLSELDEKYTLAAWNNNYFEDAVNIIYETFKDTSDALFDPRFTNLEGTRDILDKIVHNVYADFLPEATTVLLYDGTPCGLCFINLTAGTISNIPIVSILKEHQGKGLSKHMLKNSIEVVLDWVKAGDMQISEINTCTETDNYQALKMYRHVGFKEDYNYPQTYLNVKKM